MKRAALAMAVAALLACAATVMAQAPAGPPKPGPEHKKLKYYVGKWKFEGDMKASFFGPAGKVTATETCEWFAGRSSVVCHAEMKMPMGEVQQLIILTYNTEGKVYTMNAYLGTKKNFSVGFASSSTGRVEGNTWTWTGEPRMGGKLVKVRATIKPLPGGTDSVLEEMAVEDGPWSVLLEGKRLPAK